jgi:ribosome recycling factor
MPADEILFEAEEKMEKAVEVFREEMKGLRAGKATPGLVENLKVEYYGTPTPLRQLATISAPQPRLLVVKPFDPQSVKDIEKAIQQSELGINPMSDGKLIRLAIPPLSEEQRKKIAAHVRERAEAAKVAIRNIRRDANKEIDTQEKAKAEGMSEDDAERARKDVQDLTHRYETIAGEAAEKKQQEILEV